MEAQDVSGGNVRDLEGAHPSGAPVQAPPARAHRVRRRLLVALAVYLGAGLLFTLGTLVCYNLRNWEFYGGLSTPPLFLVGLPFELLGWPVSLRANLVNGLGLLGACPLP